MNFQPFRVTSFNGEGPVRVDAMRALLLEYGAKESETDRRRWRIRKEADHHELHATKTFYEDDRHLSPIAAAAERS